MICFRDMAFCDASDRCPVKDCRRNFAEAERAAARAWWGGDDAPIAFSPFVDCPDYLPAGERKAA